MDEQLFEMGMRLRELREIKGVSVEDMERTNAANSSDFSIETVPTKTGCLRLMQSFICAKIAAYFSSLFR